MEIGPVQAVVLGFPPDAKFTGAVMEELDRLQGRGVIRVLDLLFVHKGEDGELVALELRDDDADLGAIVGALLGFEFEGQEDGDARSAGLDTSEQDAEATWGLSADQLQGIAAGLPTGMSAGILLVEHAWARQLRTAVRATGGVPVAQGFLTPEAIMLVGGELQAMVSALETIERAHADQLHAEAARTGSEDDRAGGALAALDALVDGGVIEPGAVADAIEALRSAKLVDDERAHVLLHESTRGLTVSG